MLPLLKIGNTYKVILTVMGKMDKNGKKYSYQNLNYIDTKFGLRKVPKSPEFDIRYSEYYDCFKNWIIIVPCKN